MPAEESDFSRIQLVLSHVFQCSSKEQFPIEAKLDFLIIKINTVSSKLMIMGLYYSLLYGRRPSRLFL